MSRRARFYLGVVVCAAIAGLYARAAGHWDDLQFYGVGALILAVLCLLVMIWSETAHDGDLRRRPQA